MLNNFLTFLHTNDSLADLLTSLPPDQILHTSYNKSDNSSPSHQYLITLQQVECWYISNHVQTNTCFLLEIPTCLFLVSLMLIGQDAKTPGAQSQVHVSLLFIPSYRGTLRKKKVSRSSYETKYKEQVAVTCELQWLLYLLCDLQVTCVRPPILYYYDHSALRIAANHVFHKRTKYIKIDCYIVWEKL